MMSFRNGRSSRALDSTRQDIDWRPAVALMGQAFIFENAVSSEVGPCSLFFRGLPGLSRSCVCSRQPCGLRFCDVPRHIVLHPRVVLPAERRTQVLHVTVTPLLCGMICPRDRLLAAVLRIHPPIVSHAVVPDE